MAASRKMIFVCPFGCRVKLTEVLVDAVAADGSLEVVLNAELLHLTQYAHMVGTHS